MHHADTPGSPLHIAHVITRFIRGGADENTLFTCNGQAEAGHRVVLYHGRDYHPAMLARLHPKVQSVCVASLVRQIDPLLDLTALLRLAGAFRRGKFNVVHTHESKAGVLGRLAARWAGTPTVVHGVHILAHLHAAPWQAAIYLAAERLVAGGTDLFVDVSDGMRSACLEAGLGRPDQHLVIESGMDLDLFRNGNPLSPAVCAALEALGGGEPTVILMAGALEPRKRTLEFLSPFAALAATRPNLRLLIAGEGPERPRIEEAIARLELAGRVGLLGHREDLQDFIARADVCVHAAASEGLPRVAVQYVAAGKPVVATALLGLDRIIHPEQNGALTPPEDVGAMAMPLARLLDDPQARAAAAAHAAAIDVSAWSVDRMSTAMEQAYRIARTRSGSGANSEPWDRSGLPQSRGPSVEEQAGAEIFGQR